MENTNNTPVIEPLYSGDGRQLYPITHIKALIDGDGKLLKEELDGIHSDIDNINNKLSEGVGVPIVNNLTEGGEDKALSAEMGKTLSGRIEEVAENGGGVPIVDSVDKLDPNAEQGSLASVAVNTIGEILFSELYQPTTDEVNLETMSIIDTTNLSSVSGITINSSYDTSAEIQGFVIYLFSKDIDMRSGVGQVIGLAPEMAMTMNVSTQENNEFELFTPNEDGTIAVNEENLTIINNLLSSTEFVYGGVMPMDSGEFIDPSYADVFYKGIGGKQKTELYIKDVNGWKAINKESDTLYINSNALRNYEEVDLGNNLRCYKIPKNEFPLVTRGVESKDLSKYKFISYEGTTGPLLNWYNSEFGVVEQINLEGEGIEVNSSFYLILDEEFVYVGTFYKRYIEIPFRQYNSVDELWSGAEAGKTAIVVGYTPQETVLTNVSSKNWVIGIHINVPESKIIDSDVYTGFELTSEEGDKIEFNVSMHAFPTNSFSMIYARIDGEQHNIALYKPDDGSLSSYDENVINIINERLTASKYYIRTRTDTVNNYLLDSFLTLYVNKKTATAFIKNEDYWREIGEATKERVATLETKVAELEAKIQELLQN